MFGRLPVPPNDGRLDPMDEPPPLPIPLPPILPILFPIPLPDPKFGIEGLAPLFPKDGADLLGLEKFEEFGREVGMLGMLGRAPPPPTIPIDGLAPPPKFPPPPPPTPRNPSSPLNNNKLATAKTMIDNKYMYFRILYNIIRK
jgi:hypothetical protein